MPTSGRRSRQELPRVGYHCDHRITGTTEPERGTTIGASDATSRARCPSPVKRRPVDRCCGNGSAVGGYGKGMTRETPGKSVGEPRRPESDFGEDQEPVDFRDREGPTDFRDRQGPLDFDDFGDQDEGDPRNRDEKEQW
jgi:hypothetical protein